jgi:ribosomal protein S18 acetylase RimI-like enzyme
MMMKIRCMTKADLDFAFDLTSNEGWSSTRTDFEELLAYDSHGCFIGEEKNERVGMVCVIPYSEFSTIGNLIVIDDCRGRGIGTLLMEHAISYLHQKGVSIMFLDGVQPAVSLYERLGFREICKSLRLSGKVTGEDSNQVRQMEDSDLMEVLSIDRKQLTADRSFFLRSCYEYNSRFCKILEINGSIAGYIFGSLRKNSVRIGPWVMNAHRDKAEEFLQAFSAKTGNPKIQLGVLESNVSAVRLLQKLGFTETPYSLRMARGGPSKIEFSAGMYAIHSPARG